MNKISSYNIGLTPETLRNSFKQGRIPEELFEPLQALLRRITENTAEKPVSIYLFSDEGNAELRNLFGYVLAKSLLRHIPSTLLVDCEFLDVGMNGVVPQKDALGFLDLLLYGSSLGVITQETSGGVHVIGAGSFPVTKKMPFVLSAFDEAARRLVGYSRCALFSGPLHGDAGEVHPLIGAVDIPVFVRATEFAGTGVVDPIEEQIASQWDKEILSVRISTSGKPAVVSEPYQEKPKSEAPGGPEEEISLTTPEEPEVLQKGPEPVDPLEKPHFEEIASASGRERAAPPPPEKAEPPRTGREGAEKEVPELPYEEKRYTSLFPRIATWLVGIIIVIFIVWWVQQERTDGDAGEVLTQDGTPAQTEAPPAQPQGDDGEGAETQTGGTDLPVETGQTATQPAPVEAAPDTAVQAGTEPTEDQTGSGEEPAQDTADNADNILVMGDLESRWQGQYLIHVSSFRESAKAREEARYLASRDFPALIVYLDLGTKGKWYRVYVGPTKTRDEARSLKKELDDTPRVRFTRIIRVSGR